MIVVLVENDNLRVSKQKTFNELELESKPGVGNFFSSRAVSKFFWALWATIFNIHEKKVSFYIKQS